MALLRPAGPVAVQDC
jgi:hypothetical protein